MLVLNIIYDFLALSIKFCNNHFTIFLYINRNNS
nr:MAG TPA: hypothetical protein [Caudoviricetes sp.]